ncbi:MAG TPA: glycosyltransferase family 1 protein, partial [Dehalococcoidia bacterium]|nr:glycosyltransferase family 1 protein [Dehalococcoidia bacterium]
MVRPLKIAMLCIHSCPLGMPGGRDTGGMNVYIRELAQELGRRRHAVDIYTMEHQPPHEQIINLGSNVRLIHLKTDAHEEMPKVALYSCLRKFICGVESFRRSRAIHYDLIHSHYWLSGLVGKQLQSWWRVPHVVMFHTLGAVKNSIGIGEGETELRIESERQVVACCHRIIAATEREREELVRHYGAAAQKIAVIPCGVNLDLFKPGDREAARRELNLDHQKVLLFVGRIDPLKGLDRLLRALKYLNDKQPPLLMVVGGDRHSHNQVAALQRLAGELGIEHCVAFVGAVAHEKLPLFYNAADICVIPSYYESFGMVALESLACGTPIVAADIGGLRQIVRHSEIGQIAADNSVLGLARELRQFLSGSKSGSKYIDFRRAAIAEFSWTNIADMILHEYSRLLLAKGGLATAYESRHAAPLPSTARHQKASPGRQPWPVQGIS